MELIENKANRINELHNLAEMTARKTIDHCIEAGQLLSDVKESLKHGQFNNWCEDNLQLSRSTVFRYMKLFINKDVIATAETPTDALKQIDKCFKVEHLEEKEKVYDFEQTTDKKEETKYINNIEQELMKIKANTVQTSIDISVLKKFLQSCSTNDPAIIFKIGATINEINKLKNEIESLEQYNLQVVDNSLKITI
tara:strand:- start:229 stop:816 length:588 start_codon:yes stop_codon:yes gene_type:complete